MSNAPVARLQGLSEEEKEKLSGIFKRKLIFRSILFVGAILVSLGVILYFNRYSSSYKMEDNLEVINVVFVVLIVLCARLLFSEFMEYGKEKGSPNKKVIRTVVSGIHNGKIALGNKSFGKEDFLLNATDFDLLKAGDEVILELSAKSNTLFAIKRAVK